MEIIIIASIALLISGLSFYLAFKTFQVQVRPYVSIEKINVIVKEAEDKLECEAILENRGSIPANNLRLTWFGYTNGVKEYEGGAKKNFAYLTPSPSQLTYKFKRNGYKGKELMVEFILLYDGINTKNHKTYMKAEYNNERSNFYFIEAYMQ